MDGANLNFILIGGGTLMLVVLGALLYLVSTLSRPAKEAKARLEKLKTRHRGGATTGSAEARSIRINKNATGFDALLNRIIPKPAEFQARLNKTGRQITIAQYFGASGILFVLLLAVIFLVTGNSLISLLIALALGLGLPHFIIGFMVNQRIEKFTKQFPEAIDLIVRGLKAGLPINETINNVGTEVTAPTGTEFKKITDAVRFGKTLDTALWETSERLDTPDFKFFVITLSVQKETGGNLAETLSNLATILRLRQQMKLKVRALSSEARASAMILGALPFVMLGAIMVTNYDYGIVLFTHPKAIIASVAGFFWMLIGIGIMAKMINFEI